MSLKSVRLLFRRAGSNTNHPTHGICKAMPVPNHRWTYENYETESQVRGMDLGTFLRATQRQNTEGLPVRLEVPALTWRSHRAWDLLMIFTKPRADFPGRANWARSVQHFHEGNRYHISLCFVNELPEGGWEAYNRLRERYNGRSGVLKVFVTNAQAELIPDQNHLTDEILADPDVALLHNACQRYRDRPLHVST